MRREERVAPERHPVHRRPARRGLRQHLPLLFGLEPTVVTEEHELLSSVHGDGDPRTLQALATYAGVLWQLGRGSDAQELLEELVAKRTQARD